MPSLKGESALLGDDNPNKSQIEGDLNSKHEATKFDQFSNLSFAFDSGRSCQGNLG